LKKRKLGGSREKSGVGWEYSYVPSF
jgi:hypothetical protein